MEEKNKEEIHRTYQVAMEVTADGMNDPAKTDEIVRRFAQMLDALHRRTEAQSSAIVTIEVKSAKERPIIGHENQILMEGDPGVEPWRGTP